MWDFGLLCHLEAVSLIKIRFDSELHVPHLLGLRARRLEGHDPGTAKEM